MSHDHDNDQKKLWAKLAELQTKMEHLQQENHDKATQFDSMWKAVETMERTTRALVGDVRRINEKLSKAFHWWNQLNCRRCGKLLTKLTPDRKCPFCHVEEPLLDWQK